jgi:hypothetical protein
MTGMVVMNNSFWLGISPHLGKSLGGALSALLCSAAAAHHDAQHLRQQELRSTVQQMAKPAAAKPAAPVNQAAKAAAQAGVQSAADANAHHLSAQERLELRRQLTRDLQAQRNPSDSSTR